MRSQVFIENDVPYSHEPVEGWIKRRYNVQFVPTGEQFEKAVWVPTFQVLDSLIIHWNRTADWRYTI